LGSGRGGTTKGEERAIQDWDCGKKKVRVKICCKFVNHAEKKCSRSRNQRGPLAAAKKRKEHVRESQSSNTKKEDGRKDVQISLAGARGRAGSQTSFIQQGDRGEKPRTTNEKRRTTEAACRIQ